MWDARDRSSQQSCSMTKGVVRNFAKFVGKHLRRLWHRCFDVNFARPATLLKKKLLHWCFRVNFAKFLRTSFLQNNSGRLFLEIKYEVSKLVRKFTILSPKSVYNPPHAYLTETGAVRRVFDTFFIARINMWERQLGMKILW